MPPEGGMLLGTAPAGQAGRAQRVVRQRQQQARRHRRSQRGDRECVQEKASSAACDRIEITSNDKGTFATFVGLTGADGGQGAATRE